MARRARDVLWWEQGFTEDHLPPSQQGEHAGQLDGMPDVGNLTHGVEVFSEEADWWCVHRWNVKQDLPSIVRTQPSVRMHGVGHDVPLIRARIPAS